MIILLASRSNLCYSLSCGSKYAHILVWLSQNSIPKFYSNIFSALKIASGCRIALRVTLLCFAVVEMMLLNTLLVRMLR